MKKLLIALLLFFSFNQVYALERCTKSDDYKLYEKLNEEEKENYIEPMYCKEVMNSTVNNNYKKSVQLRNAFGKISVGTALSSRYNAYEEGYITNIKNQYNLGTCWAFSAISSVESNALKNGLEEYDFSEAHLIYSIISGGYSDEQGKIGKYKRENLNGGQINYAATYYLNDYGQLLEEEMAYPKTYQTITSNEYIQGNKMISIEKYEINNFDSYDICSDQEIEKIKNQLINNGAVQGTMYMDENLFHDSNNDYYISTTANAPSVNHGISIIGWDDTIDKSKFQGATRNGAWIIKNSWGDNWSNDGMFYISYDDYFICKNVASYSGVSNTTFDNYYKAADVVGLPEFYFDNTFYLSTKFTKQNEENEELKRVSFATGNNSSYKIYLSKNNVLTNKSNWILLKEGTSNELGIDSANLENITIENDFTIIVEYTALDNNYSTLLTLCTNHDDTEDLEISKNTNYYTTNINHWYDYESIQIGDETLKCEPNIYAYTNTIKNNDEPNNDITLTISEIIKPNDNTIKVTINKENVDPNNITYKIINSKNEDVTSHFTINPVYDNNEITIVSDNTISDTFTLKIYYEDLTITQTFKLDEIVSGLNNKIKIEANNIYLIVNKNSTYNYKNLIDSITIKNTTISVKDLSNLLVTNNQSPIGTNYKFVTNNKTYTIILKGDITGDGTVNSADLLKIVKHLKGSSILNSGQKSASDCTNDNVINSADLLKIVKYLKGTTTISF